MAYPTVGARDDLPRTVRSCGVRRTASRDLSAGDGVFQQYGSRDLRARADPYKAARSHQKAIVEKEHFLLQKLYEGLTGDVEFYSSLENSTPIVALNIPGKDSAYVSDLLNYKYGIVTRCGAHCAPLMHKHLKTEEQGIVRLSVSFQNTIEDVDFVVRAIQEISNDH